MGLGHVVADSPVRQELGQLEQILLLLSLRLLQSGGPTGR